MAAGLSPWPGKLVFFVLPGSDPLLCSDLGAPKQSCAPQLDADTTQY